MKCRLLTTFFVLASLPMICDPNFVLLLTHTPFLEIWDRLEPSRLLSAGGPGNFRFFCSFCVRCLVFCALGAKGSERLPANDC